MMHYFQICKICNWKYLNKKSGCRQVLAKSNHLLTSKFLTIYPCIINQRKLRKREYTFYTIFYIKENLKEKTRQDLHLKMNQKSSDNMRHVEKHK